MTYEERRTFRDLTDRASALRERLETGEGQGPVTREEAHAMAVLIEEILAQLSPERWDRMMENIAEEVMRRASGMAAVK